MKMWSLGELLFILCLALRHAAGLIHVSGYEKSDAKVSCPYANYESNEKYLCRDLCAEEDILIKTTEGKRSRYSSHDDRTKHIFTTTISDLSWADAGKYWCAVSRIGMDHYPDEVSLQVVPDTCCEQVTTSEGSESGSVSITCEYEPKYQNHMKYLCRGAQPSICLKQALITSNSNHGNKRFTLTDEEPHGKFTVTISGLIREDSGSYLCGVRRDTDLDVFSAARLEVKVSQTTTTTAVTVETLTSSSTTVKPDGGASFLLTVVSGATAPLLLLLTLAVAVVVVYRQKRRKWQAGDGVTMSRVTVDAANAEGIYEVEDAKRCAKQRPPPKQQSACQTCDDSDAVYENIHVTDDIYCNRMIGDRRQEMKHTC